MGCAEPLSFLKTVYVFMYTLVLERRWGGYQHTVSDATSPSCKAITHHAMRFLSVVT